MKKVLASGEPPDGTLVESGSMAADDAAKLRPLGATAAVIGTVVDAAGRPMLHLLNALGFRVDRVCWQPKWWRNTPLTIEDNKAVARRFFAALSRGDIDGTGALMAEDHVFYFPLLPEPADKAAHIAGQRALVAAIPNFHETVVDQFAEGDLVFNRLHMTGTRTGAMMGVPGGGQTVELSVFNVMRIRDGLIVDEWDEFDTLSFLVQLGIIAKPVFGHVGD